MFEKLSTSESDLELIAAQANDESEKLKYVCKLKNCNKRFKRQTHLDRHEYHHDGVKKHVCSYDDCDKSYIISTHLIRHVQTFHEKFRKPKTFKCSITSCNKSFDSLYNVQRHIANFHKNSKMYNCKNCNKEFPRKLALRRHEVLQHGTEYPYKCNICRRGYIQEVHLKKHKCLQKECRYKCERCKELFPKWSLLIEHSKKEHDTAFVCKCCGREFQRKIDIQNHENSIKRKLENQVVKLQCPYEGCDRIYNFQKNLTQHIKVKHLSEKFKCPFDECGKELASKQKLNHHIRKLHDAEANVCNSNIVKPKKKRKPRKDIGIPKRSYASQLSNVVISTAVEKGFVHTNTELIDVAKDSDISHSETENDEKVSGAVLTLDLEKK